MWIDDGEATEEDLAWQAWFAQQERAGVARLEETAKGLLQIVMAVFSVLFGVLLLAGPPPDVIGAGEPSSYLLDPTVRDFGIASVLLYFGSFFAAWLVFIPFPSGWYQRDNVSQMQRVYRRLQTGKMICLYVALLLFLLGSGSFGGLIIKALLWEPVF